MGLVIRIREDPHGTDVSAGLALCLYRDVLYDELRPLEDGSARHYLVRETHLLVPQIGEGPYHDRDGVDLLQLVLRQLIDDCIDHTGHDRDLVHAPVTSGRLIIDARPMVR